MTALVYLSVLDIRTRTIPMEGLIILHILVMIYHGVARQVALPLIIGGVMVGLIFVIISRITREGVGYGDSWMILILGTYLGLWKLLEVLTAAFLGLALMSMIILVLKKMSRDVTVPFIPFLAAGYFLTMIFEV
jgi:prepilin signal peptidase PulO-like enzyme (type II secretory pathway)